MLWISLLWSAHAEEPLKPHLVCPGKRAEWSCDSALPPGSVKPEIRTDADLVATGARPADFADYTYVPSIDLYLACMTDEHCLSKYDGQKVWTIGLYRRGREASSLATMMWFSPGEVPQQVPDIDFGRNHPYPQDWVVAYGTIRSGKGRAYGHLNNSFGRFEGAVTFYVSDAYVFEKLRGDADKYRALAEVKSVPPAKIEELLAHISPEADAEAP